MKMKQLFNWILILTAGVFAACSSLQDVDVQTVNFSGEVFEFEKRFAYIDADFNFSKGKVQPAEELKADLEKALGNPGISKAVAARLCSLNGCLSLLLNKNAEAKQMLTDSGNYFKGDLFALILSHRIDPKVSLNADVNKEEKSSEKGIIVLEEALDLYRSKNYLEAVARFDTAFISLNSFYRDAYSEIRNHCWSMRSVISASPEEDLLRLKMITVSQMIQLTEKRTDLLYSITGGKNLTEKNLYQKVAGSGLLNPVSQELNAENAVSADYMVTKLIAGRFLWNLYNSTRNKRAENAVKYSAQYKKSGKKSPVRDVAVDNADFDAVLGCVEKEILNLEDGLNFQGQRELSALEFSESLEKLTK